MASTKQRSVDTRFWTDTWIRKLNALDRYVFLYFLTNEHSSWCGVYELSINMAAFETGIDENDLKRSILPRLRPRLIFIDGWVYVKNWEKYHNNDSYKTHKAVLDAWGAVPEKIRLKIKEIEEKEIPHGRGIEGVSPSTSTSTLTSASALALSSITPKGVLPFSLKEEIKKLEDSDRRDLNIIALYFENRKPDIQSREQLSVAIRRHLRAAKELSPFTNDQILKAIPKAKSQTSEWTIETIIKILTK